MCRITGFFIFYICLECMILSADESKVHVPYSIMMKDDIDALVGDLTEAQKNGSGIQKHWREYIKKIRNDASKNHKKALAFVKKGKFYVTLKRTTFIKEFGGFEHTPVCIVLPVSQKSVLIGQQICTTPSFKRLYPVSEFIVELKKELENLTYDIGEDQKRLEELNEKHKTLVDLIAKIVATISAHNDESNSLNDNSYDEDRLNELIMLYKRQIKDVNAEIRDVEKSIKLLQKRDKVVLLAHDVIIEQMRYYRIPVPSIAEEKDAPDSTISKLRELDKMLKEKLINQKDYDTAKKKLLDNM